MQEVARRHEQHAAAGCSGRRQAGGSGAFPPMFRAALFAHPHRADSASVQIQHGDGVCGSSGAGTMAEQPQLPREDREFLQDSPDKVMVALGTRARSVASAARAATAAACTASRCQALRHPQTC